MASTQNYQVHVFATVKDPRNDIPTRLNLRLDVQAMGIEGAIPEATKYFQAMRLGPSLGWISTFEIIGITLMGD